MTIRGHVVSRPGIVPGMGHQRSAPDIRALWLASSGRGAVEPIEAVEVAMTMELRLQAGRVEPAAVEASPMERPDQREQDCQMANVDRQEVLV